MSYERRKFILTLFIIAAIGFYSCGCSRESQEEGAEEQPGAVQAGLIYNFSDKLGGAEITTAGADYVRVAKTGFAVNNDERGVLFEHPNSEVVFKGVPVYKNAELKFGIGINQNAWDKPGDGVLFEVTVVDERSHPSVIFSQYIDPKNDIGDRKWFDNNIDLNAFAGQKVSFIFKTAAGPKSDGLYDWAAWSSPQIVPRVEKAPDYYTKGDYINVVLITLDAARADRFSFNGNPTGLTPNIDQLIEAGIAFKRAYCYSGSTPPSMGAIFTSKLPYWPPKAPGGGPRWGAKHVFGLTRFFDNGELRPGIPESVDTLPVILKRHGYTTVGISTNPYLSRDFGFQRGFDFFEELSPRDARYANAEEVSQKAQTYLSELRGDKFFVWIHFMDLHAPLVNYAEFREEAKSKRVQTPYRPVSEWTQYAKDHMTKFDSLALSKWIPDAGWDADKEGLLKVRDEYTLAYDAELLRVDKQIGVIMDRLRQYGLWDNTLIIILNDHGDEFMEHGDWSHTGQLYEQIVRGVWVMYNPKLLRTPETVDTPVSHVDVMPTLLELLRFREDSTPFDGVSQLPLPRRKPKREERFVFGVLDQRAYVTDGEYKLIINNDFGKDFSKGGIGPARHPPIAPMELYNLKNDPGEQHNLAEHFSQIADGLHAKIKRAFMEKGIQFWSAEPDQSEEVSNRSEGISKETLERLKSLGYMQ